MGIHVNLGFETAPTIDKIDITGSTVLPIGIFIELIQQGVLGYDRNLADSTLTSSRAFIYMTKWMKGENISQYLTVAYRNGQLREEDVSLADINELYINEKCVGLLGRAVPLAQNAYTCAKLGRKAGFYLIDDQQGLGGASFDEELSFDEPELDLDLVR